MTRKLTPKQEMFCLEYLKDLNATQAYIRAGYKVNGATARVNASKLLANPNISARIEQMKNKRAAKIELDSDWVLKNLIAVAERAMQAVPVEVWDPQAKEMVPTGEFTFDSNGANKALELIGKHIGLFDPKHGRIAALSDAQIEKIRAETDFIKERTKLIKGSKKDTGLLDALINAVEGSK